MDALDQKMIAHLQASYVIPIPRAISAATVAFVRCSIPIAGPAASPTNQCGALKNAQDGPALVTEFRFSSPKQITNGWIIYWNGG